MKKIILSLAMCAISSISFAQKGDFVVEGALEFNTTKSTPENGIDSKNTSFSLLPGFSYYYENNLAIGANIGFTYNKVGASNAETSLFVFEPFLRYILPLNDKFNYAPEGFIGIGLGSYEVNDHSNDITTWKIGIKAVRFEYKITQKMRLSFSAGTIGYEHIKIENVGKTSSFSVGINIEPTLGFAYVL